MSSDKLLLRALRREPCERPPIWLMRQAGRYLPEYRALRAEVGGFLELCYTPELAVEVTLQPIRRYGFDAAILFSDILVVPHALGQDVRFEEGVGPRLDALTRSADVERLTPDVVLDRLEPVFETLRGLSVALPPETCLIGFAGAPWTVATYMVEGGSSRDFATVKAWAYGDPDGFQRLIDLLVDSTTSYLSAQVEAGAEVLQLFDSWAGALPASELRRWSLEPMARIVAALKERHPGVPVILFPRGVGLGYEAFAAESGADGLSIDAGISTSWASDSLQKRVTVQGNLDPIKLVAGGDGQRLAVEAILNDLGSGPFIFNLGHGIVPQTPPEHVEALVAQVRAGASSPPGVPQ